MFGQSVSSFFPSESRRVAGSVVGLAAMACLLELEEKLSCPICMELFTEPATMPCGHSFCLRCLQDYLGRQRLPDCPSCRTAFQPQLQPLAKNLVLDEMVKMVKLSSGSCPLRASTEPGACPAHSKPLDLYCRLDRRCICSACAVKEHRGHPVVTVEDEWAQREDSASRAQTSYINKFDVLAKELEEVKAKVIEYIVTKECGSLELVDCTMEKLEERCAELREVRLKLETTLKTNDPFQILQFPQEIQVLKKSPPDMVWPVPGLGVEDKLEAVKQGLEEISLLIYKGLQGCFRQAPESKEISESSGNIRSISVNPEPPALPSSSHIREPFILNYRQLSFNPNTAHRYLTLSKDGCRVSHRGAQKYPMRVERFEREWQVLCCESLDAGQHYWEMQISSQWAYLGVTYSTIDRCGTSSLIGRNNVSWSLQVFSMSYSAWHADKEVKLPPAKYQRFGLHLDYTAGTLDFYGIGDTMTLIHTFHSVFTQPLYPAVWVGENVVATLCQPQ
ncbi:tripartite motif-containing protein 65-like isoform X3 [Leucoraja erinacea]|uniref:tripartite motif-containing protein 65-like isoform X3 n=1 Tax=Leucoraja erinaceus TaxID=7782 RepID=UPI0024580767|nr:tripartite motif-containing protein 65-like isoform X3 [Leucoraja erinacea]